MLVDNFYLTLIIYLLNIMSIVRPFMYSFMMHELGIKNFKKRELAEWFKATSLKLVKYYYFIRSNRIFSA